MGYKVREVRRKRPDSRTQHNADGHADCNIVHGRADRGPQCYPQPSP